MEHYVYVWRDASGTPFYVGKGMGKRARTTAARSEEFKAIHAQGGCTVEIVDYFIHESQAHAYEVELIEMYGRRDRGGVLVNKTDGGEGQSGVVTTDGKRAKLSAAFKGIPKSEDARKKMSVAKTGTKLSDDTRRKMREARRGRGPTPLAIKLAADAKRGKKRDPSITAKRVSAMRLQPPRGTSGFKGVTYSKEDRAWVASLSKENTRVRLGSYKTPEDAAMSYDKAAVAQWGFGKCFLNFPDYAKERAA